ncbi:MAG: glutamate racemase [Christensenellales bacterium]
MESIFVFDSGSGGEFVTKELLRALPQENFVLYKDVKNCPYSTKSKIKLWHIACKILKTATKVLSPKAIVVACNTMSSLFENRIRKKFGTIPIFFVTPMITNKILSKKTLVLATTRTVSCNKEVLSAKSNKNCIVVGFDNLAKMIDLAKDSPKVDADIKLLLLNSLSKYKIFGIKNIVLGCTHYSYIKKHLKEIFGNVKFYEKSKIIAQELKDYLQNSNPEESKILSKKNLKTIFNKQVIVVENIKELKLFA